MSECIPKSSNGLYRDKFGIVKYKDFIRSDMMFRHAHIPIRAGRTLSRSIYIRCPKCGRIGRLISRRRYKCGRRLYTVLHRSNKVANRVVACRIPLTHPANEYVDAVYRKYRIEQEWW